MPKSFKIRQAIDNHPLTADLLATGWEPFGCMPAEIPVATPSGLSLVASTHQPKTQMVMVLMLKKEFEISDEDRDQAALRLLNMEAKKEETSHG